MDGDLRRADAWLADGGDDLDRGAQLLAEKMVDDLAEAGIVERGDDVVRLTEEYLSAHRLPGGGVRMVWAGGATYDALPADIRETRREIDRDRENASAAVLTASKYRREVKAPEQRKGKSKTDAEELFESLRAFGYLEAFPITISSSGRVIEGNHRLEFAELARRSLLEEREQVASNGSDPLLLADLDRRIASLARDRIMGLAVHPDGRAADDVKVIVASQIKIPWLSHERKQLAKRLYLDGYDVASIAKTLDASERSVQEWTREDRASTQAEREAAQNAEIERLADLGWSYKQIGKRVGVSDRTVSARLNQGRSKREPAEASRSARPPRISDADLAQAADEFFAEGGTSSKTLNARLREQGRSTQQLRVDTAWRKAKERGVARRAQEQLTGAPVPIITPPESRTCDKCGGTGQLVD